MPAESQSQLGMGSWNDAFTTIGPVDITILNKQQKQNKNATGPFCVLISLFQ